MVDIGILELCGIIGVLATGFAGPIAVVRWCAASIDTKITDAKETLQTAITTVESTLKSTVEHQGHKLNNTASRVDAIERLRITDVERIVKVESNLSNLERGQERIEHQLEKMEVDSEKGRAEIIESLRELRTSKLKD